MKKSRTLALALLLLVTSTLFSSCATLHLWRWGLGNRSFIDEPKTEFSAAVLKPTATILGSPVTVAWDAVTLPLQMIFQVYPYFNQVHLAPAEVEGK